MFRVYISIVWSYLVKSKKYNITANLLIFLASFMTSSVLIANEAFMLISEEEYLQQLDYEGTNSKQMKPRTRSFFSANPNAPRISVNLPAMTSELYSPIKIDINFSASDDANIKIETLEVLYGWLNLDITDRIKQHAQISHDGITADNVNLPIGKHNITIKIKDTKQRISEKNISFEVLEPNI